MTPTPLIRPYSISVSKRVHWALKIIASGLRGDSPPAPEFTADGVADAMLEGVIERSYPKLLDGFKRREQVDADYQAMVQLGAAAGKHDAAVLKAKEQP